MSGAVSGTLCSTWVPGSERVGFFCSGQLLSQGSASQDGTDYRLAIRTDSKDPPGTFVVEVQPLRGSLLAGLAYAYDWPDGATGTVTPTADGFHFDHVVLPADPGSDRYQPATGSLTLDGDVTCRHGP